MRGVASPTWLKSRATKGAFSKRNSIVPHNGVSFGFVINHCGNTINSGITAGSAGRHHPANGDDWNGGKWGLQTVGRNVLWEPRTPGEARPGINQRVARNQKSAHCCHTCPDYLQVIDWFSLSNDWSFFPVICHLWIRHGLIVFVWRDGSCKNKTRGTRQRAAHQSSTCRRLWE